MASLTTSAISCEETSYITPKGLGFSLYCNSDQTDIGDIDSSGADNVEDCMNQCSTHPDHLCGAAAFDSTTLKCFFKNSSVTSDGAVTRDGWILGIANATQLQPLSEICSSSGQTQTSQNGLGFTTYCNQTVGGYDICPDSAPDCRAHTTTFEECLEFCSTMHPLCTGVAWDPTLKLGYQNCYPKNVSPQAFDNARGSNRDGLRCGKALLQPANDDCHASANTTITASNKETFELSCEESGTGNNITVQHSSSLGDCIDSCANYTEPPCLSAVFDANMVNGFDNCYLKSTIGNSISGQAGFTFANRKLASNDSTPGNFSSAQSSGAPDQSHERSKAWIAGSIVAVIALLIAALCWCWWWKKSRSKERQEEQQKREEQERRERQEEKDIQYWNTLVKERWEKPELYTNASTYELDPGNIYATTRELDSRSKAHVIHEMGPGLERLQSQEA